MAQEGLVALENQMLLVSLVHLVDLVGLVALADPEDLRVL